MRHRWRRHQRTASPWNQPAWKQACCWTFQRGRGCPRVLLLREVEAIVSAFDVDAEEEVEVAHVKGPNG